MPRGSLLTLEQNCEVENTKHQGSVLQETLKKLYSKIIGILSVQQYEKILVLISFIYCLSNGQLCEI